MCIQLGSGEAYTYYVLPHKGGSTFVKCPQIVLEINRSLTFHLLNNIDLSNITKNRQNYNTNYLTFSFIVKLYKKRFFLI